MSFLQHFTELWGLDRRCNYDKKSCCFHSSERKGGKKRYDSAQVRVPSPVHACWCGFSWNLDDPRRLRCSPVERLNTSPKSPWKQIEERIPEGNWGFLSILAFFFFLHRLHGRFFFFFGMKRTWMSNLRKKLNPRPPSLLLPSHQWGISATLIHVLHSFFPLFHPWAWKKADGRVAAPLVEGSRGNLHYVIVARLQSRRLTMLRSEIHRPEKIKKTWQH